jgi:diacylglycerol kinase (ATP)
LNSGPPVPQTGALTGLRYAPPMPPDYSQRPSGAQSLQDKLPSALNSLAGMVASQSQLPLFANHALRHKPRGLPHRSRESAPWRKVAHFPRWPLHRISVVKRIFSATINSLRAIGYGFRSEAALREEMILLAAGLPLGLVIAPTVAWYVAMIASLLGLLAIEFLNTAVEKLSDHVTPEHHMAIGRIKDYGSAAVFCGICFAGLVWLAALVLRIGLI